MPEVLVFWLKISGAAIGSSIAVVFKPSGDTRLKLLQRFVIGTILGFIFAPQLLDFFDWGHTLDYWLASATICGLLGYLTLQFLFSSDLRDAINKRIEK